MQLHPSFIPLLLSFLTLNAKLVSAYLTLGDVNEITNLTVKGREWIVIGGGDEVGRGGDWIQRVLVEGVSGGRGRDRDDVEEDVEASINILNQAILKHLNTPTPKPSISDSILSCNNIINDYHTFLQQTTLFLRAIEDTLIIWEWESVSPVFNSLGYLQALWASRKPNKQNRSFIEQQMVMYKETACFGGEEGKNEVLRRDVELVEYMNDLLDGFR